MAAVVVRVIDQEPTHTAVAHLGEGDLGRAVGHAVAYTAGRWPGVFLRALSAIWVSDCKFINESAPLAVVYEIGKTNNAYMYVLASLVAAFLGIVCFTAAIRSLRSGMLVGRVSRIYRTRQPLGFFVGVVALFFSGTILFVVSGIFASN